MPDVPAPSGMATDSSGGPVIDPTKNVLDLFQAGMTRQDDLRRLEFTSIRTEVTNELTAIRTEQKNEVAAIRRELEDFKEYLAAIDRAETDRINAIRAVDVAAVAVANTAAENRATTLAGQVNAAKDAQIVALKAETDPIRKDIGDLRQSQWTIAGGHEQVVEHRSASGNWAIWAGVGIAVFTAAVSTLLTIVSIGVVIYVNSK